MYFLLLNEGFNSDSEDFDQSMKKKRKNQYRGSGSVLGANGRLKSMIRVKVVPKTVQPDASSMDKSYYDPISVLEQKLPVKLYDSVGDMELDSEFEVKGKYKHVNNATQAAFESEAYATTVQLSETLPRLFFDNFHSKLGLQDIHAPTYGVTKYT
nr:ethylene response factor 1 [Ipomoea batatas]